MNLKDKKILLEIARKAIEFALERKKFEPSEEIKKKFSIKKASFVTLTLKGELRGCIGSLIARQDLWKDVIENAQNAAFFDLRFAPLTKGELKKIRIEISLLTKPKKILYEHTNDLKKKIFGKGVIIKRGFNSATYLPQVWEEIKNEEEFLSSLCIKAGIPEDSWKNEKEKLEVWIYNVDKIKE